jgi:soluble lytic murein transglycosylase-like protein
LIAALLWSVTGFVDAARADPASVIQEVNRSPRDPVADFVDEAAQRFGIPAHWIRAVMRVESVYNVHATSSKGAIGLMQIMPETWAELRARYDLGADPYDPRDNILAGAAYLREMHDRYGSPGFLAAYNAGPTRYEEHLTTGLELPAETQAYVATLAPMVEAGQVGREIIASRGALSWRQAPLFVEHAANGSAVGPPLSSGRLYRPTTSRAIVDPSALAPQSGDLSCGARARFRRGDGKRR